MFRYLFLLALLPSIVSAQSSSDYTVRLTATVQVTPPSITINWPVDADATAYTVYRKEKSATTWGTAIATLTGTDNQYTDNNVASDTAYEYRVSKTSTTVSGAVGYIYAGIQNPATHWRGTLLLIVDSFFVDSLSVELFRLMKDISGNGWAVQRYDISRNDSVPYVKNIIVNAYNADPENVKAILLVGHVPVPYSGDIYPDGHPDHKGAWPADVFYGDVNGGWSDVLVNDTVASRPENDNIPGDGKFDQSVIASDIELQVSRIDVYNMPSFAQTEFVLMKRYLDKDHAYRQKLIDVTHRGLVDDNFGAFGGEAFAASAWRNFAPLVGDTNTFALDFITTLDTASYQWAYGCGGGWYSGAGGVGSTTDFANNSVNSIFTMLFGSYFGDWDSQDNFLRAPLCADEPALTCAWAGRPHWYFYHMGLGENIGYASRLSQNSPYSLYSANYGQRYVHVALMGDLTLEQNVVIPPSSLSLTTPTNGYGTLLSWTASPDDLVGYYVYRGIEEFGKYDCISSLISNTAFTDTIGTLPDTYYYMIRAAKMEDTPSGTYVNLSEGISDSTSVVFYNSVKSVDNVALSIYPNPTQEIIWLSVSQPSPSQWQITDSYGRTLQSGSTNGRLQSIDVSNLSSGIYQLRFNSNSFSTKSFTIIK